MEHNIHIGAIQWWVDSLMAKKQRATHIGDVQIVNDNIPPFID
jgi:hypothetical protein